MKIKKELLLEMDCWNRLQASFETWTCLNKSCSKTYILRSALYFLHLTSIIRYCVLTKNELSIQRNQFLWIFLKIHLKSQEPKTLLWK